MTTPLGSTDLPRLSPPSILPESGQRLKAPHPQGWEAAANRFRRRSNRVALAFGLGGGLLATAGGVFGACMPYQHPLAVAVSVIWWGIYYGCFGMGLAALFCFLTGRIPSVPTARTEGAEKPPSGTAPGVPTASPPEERLPVTALQP
jgi:hypothetical protein